MKRGILVFIFILFLFVFPISVFAQGTFGIEQTIGQIDSSPSADATTSAKPTPSPKEDVTKPEAPQEREELLKLFEKRQINQPNITNFFAYAMQQVVRAGVPANTVILILLLPVLATIFAFLRHVVGVPSLGMLVPIALSITLLATGITAGLLLFFSIILGSTIARILLKKVRIMQLPKVSLSMLLVSFVILATMYAAASNGIFEVKDLSIFPVLLLILLSQEIVTLQLERSIRETATITFFTILFGIGGFFLLSFEPLRQMVLLYPEFILLLIPINIVIGRYFGLRLTEYMRFSSMFRYASK